MPLRRAVFSVGIVLVVWTADRASKIWAMRDLIEGRTVDVWGNWFGWTLHHNTGAAFGLAAGSPVLLQIFATCLTIALALWWLRVLRRSSEAFNGHEASAIALILGGSAGNLTDRFAFGAVIDFIDFKVWPIFNAADIAISVGAVLWALCVVFGRNARSVGA